MKKILYTLLSTLFVLSVVSCGSTNEVNKVEEETMERPVIIGMANPFVTSDSIEESEKLAVFTLALPSEDMLPDWVTLSTYRSSVVNMKLIEVIYSEDDTYQREIRIRKGLTDKEEISGDYNSYEKEKNLTMGDLKVTTYSNADLIYLATWNNGEYKYSISSTDGFTLDVLTSFIDSIK